MRIIIHGNYSNDIHKKFGNIQEYSRILKTVNSRVLFECEASLKLPLRCYKKWYNSLHTLKVHYGYHSHLKILSKMVFFSIRITWPFEIFVEIKKYSFQDTSSLPKSKWLGYPYMRKVSLQNFIMTMVFLTLKFTSCST